MQIGVRIHETRICIKPIRRSKLNKKLSEFGSGQINSGVATSSSEHLSNHATMPISLNLIFNKVM